MYSLLLRGWWVGKREREMASKEKFVNYESLFEKETGAIKRSKKRLKFVHV